MEELLKNGTLAVIAKENLHYITSNSPEAGRPKGGVKNLEGNN
jgi:hypothetical protein